MQFMDLQQNAISEIEATPRRRLMHLSRWLVSAIVIIVGAASSFAEPPKLQPQKHFAIEKGTVREMKLNADGSLLAVSVPDDELGSRGELQIWDVEAGKKLREENVASTSVAFSDDGKHIACLSESGKVVVKNAQDGKLQHELGTFETIYAIRFVSRGKGVCVFGQIADENQSTLRGWRLSDGKQVISRSVDQDEINSACIFPDGETLGIGTYDGQVFVIKTLRDKIEKRVFGEGSGFEISAIACSSDGKLLVSKIYEGACSIWDTTTGKMISTIRLESLCDEIQIFPTSKLAAVSESVAFDRDILLADLSSGTTAAILTGFPKAEIGRNVWTKHFSLSSNGERLIAWAEPENEMYVWDTKKFAAVEPSKER